MKNREQIRARNALRTLNEEMSRGAEGGDALTGFPALIIGNGLLATIAYSLEKKHGYPLICNAIAAHLADPEIGLLPPGKGDVEGMRRVLVEEDSERLRLCTAEALAFLNYLRRFAKASD